MKVKSSLFKLDSNIDGTYFDKNGDVKIIKNMIQSVGATDGPAIHPIGDKLNAKILSEELNLVPDLTITVNTLGHGILYDKEGNPIAYKGDLILRDGLGNEVSLKKLTLKSNSILEENGDIFLRDKSLQQFDSSEKGISLDRLMNTAIQQTSQASGNIVQATRNEDTNVNSVSLFTTKMSEQNHVWIVASAMVNKKTKIRIKDITADIVLDEGFINPKQNNIYPVFASYTGTLPFITNNNSAVSQDSCDSFIWNSFLKKYFKAKQTTLDNIIQVHEIALEVVDGSNFIMGNINLLAMDNNINNQLIFSGENVINDADTELIKFTTAMTNKNYSITIQTENSIQTWYETKSTTGFSIRFERNYTGKVFWSALLIER